MLLIQYVLFFILGAAAIAFFMLLLVPIVWRRALYLAHQAIRMEIPLSLDEVEAAHDFARAIHAVEICRYEEQIAVAKSQAMEARLALDMARAKICYLAPFEEEAKTLQQAISQAHEKHRQLSLDNKAKSLKLKKMAGLSQEKKRATAKIKKQKSIIKSLKRQISGLKRQLSHLEKQGEKLEKKLYHHAAMMNKWPNKEEFLVLRQQIQQIAAQIVAESTRSEGEISNLLALIGESADQNDLAGAIHQAMVVPASPVASSTPVASPTAE